MNLTMMDTDDSCEYNRSGIHCGSCKDGYSLMLYNFHCWECDDTNLSLLVFFAFAGIALIIALLLLQMTVAQGVINGMIFYTNAFSIYSYFVFHEEKDVELVFQIFIAWANLDFGIPICFVSGLDHYSYTWLQFLFPLYLWLLIAVIIIGCQLSSRFGTLLGSNPTAVLATVILMSFTKLVQTSEQALAWQKINSTSNGTEYGWRMDPSIKYLDAKHIFLFIAGISTVFLLLIPYISLLLFGYKIQKYSSKKGFRWFNYFKPILDAYYAPYNKNSRFWVGFLLLVRSTLFLSMCFLHDYTLYIPVTMSVIFVAVLAVAWLNSRIYESFYTEVLEASFILNICILGIASYFVNLTEVDDDVTEVDDDVTKEKVERLIINNISVGIAFVEFIGIVIFHIILCIKKVFFKKSKLLSSKKLLKVLKVNQSTGENDNNKTSNNNMMMMPLREPLLDD